ncbi:hypothetical protein ACFS7Z_23495, partial [Pontibacter toksunensis]
PNREVKPGRADGTGVTPGRVGGRQPQQQGAPCPKRQGALLLYSLATCSSGSKRVPASAPKAEGKACSIV